MSSGSDRSRTAVGDALPPEIVRFFTSSASQTITVRGPPGAGKTTFALEVLARFAGYRAFVSTRVPRPSLIRDHAWVDPANGSDIDLVETLRFRGGAQSPVLHVGTLRDALQDRASDLVDLSSILALPKELESGFSAHANDRKLVAIDSWDAWVENLLGPTPFAVDVPTTRWELERSLLERLRDAGTHLILVVEREERAQLDYVTDGSLTLSVTESDGRAERWIYFQKLRGTRLEEISYPFTLEGGRFLCIRPTPFGGLSAPIPVEPDPGRAMPGIWPGSAALAARCGRLPVPGTTLFEADSETPLRLLARLVIPIVASALRSGGWAIARPPAHFAAGEMLAGLSPAFPGAAPPGALRILSSEPEEPGEPAGGPVVHMASEGVDEVRKAVGSLDALGFFRAALPEGAHSVLAVFLEPTLEPAGAAGELESFLSLAEAARRSSGRAATVIAARTRSPLIEAIRSRSALHLLVTTRRGHYFLTGIRPWTPQLALSLPVGDRKATVPYELTPIV
jgi:KaiC/GvpD/RAD55 family RecA-like ATPase